MPVITDRYNSKNSKHKWQIYGYILSEKDF